MVTFLTHSNVINKLKCLLCLSLFIFFVFFYIIYFHNTHHRVPLKMRINMIITIKQPHPPPPPSSPLFLSSSRRIYQSRNKLSHIIFPPLGLKLFLPFLAFPNTMIVYPIFSLKSIVFVKKVYL